MNGLSLRRRVMSTGSGFAPLPIPSLSPTLNDFGVYKLSPISITSNTSLSLYVKTGNVSYEHFGTVLATWTLIVTITASNIVIDYNGGNNSSGAFVGFPVVIRSGSGTENGTASVMYSVQQIS